MQQLDLANFIKLHHYASYLRRMIMPSRLDYYVSLSHVISLFQYRSRGALFIKIVVVIALRQYSRSPLSLSAITRCSNVRLNYFLLLLYGRHHHASSKCFGNTHYVLWYHTFSSILYKRAFIVSPFFIVILVMHCHHIHN
jgi:hypothetical protein